MLCEKDEKILFSPGSLSECSIVTEVLYNTAEQFTTIKLSNSQPYPADFW